MCHWSLIWRSMRVNAENEASHVAELMPNVKAVAYRLYTIWKAVFTVWTVVQTGLTATFNSYRNRQISTPTKSIPLNRSTQNRHNWLHPRGDPLYQIWCKSVNSGLLGKWVKYNKFYFYLFIYLFILFFFDQPAGQTRRWIFTRDSSKDVKSRKDVPFWGSKTCLNLILSPYLSPKTVKFWPKTGLFRPKMFNNGGTQEYTTFNHHCSPIKVA